MEVEGDDGFDTPRGACGCVGGNNACGCGYVGGPCGCVGGNGVGNASGCVGGNGARGCRGGGAHTARAGNAHGNATPVAALEATAPVAAEAVARRCATTIFANSLARNSVRVCSNASLIRPICLRETVLPSPHRSRRLTAKDRKEALGRAKPTRAIHCKSITFSTPALAVESPPHAQRFFQGAEGWRRLRGFLAASDTRGTSACARFTSSLMRPHNVGRGIKPARSKDSGQARMAGCRVAPLSP